MIHLDLPTKSSGRFLILIEGKNKRRLCSKFRLQHKLLYHMGPVIQQIQGYLKCLWQRCCKEPVAIVHCSSSLLKEPVLEKPAFLNTP